MASLNLLPLPEFNPDIDIGLSISKRWEKWLCEFSMYVEANGITDTTRQRALLLYMVAGSVREIFDTRSETGEVSDFETAKAKLTEYFKPQENKRYKTYQYRHLHQGNKESLDTFDTRLRTHRRMWIYRR